MRKLSTSLSFIVLALLFFAACLQPVSFLPTSNVNSPNLNRDPIDSPFPYACLVESVDGDRSGVNYPQIGVPSIFETPTGDFKFELTLVSREISIRVSWRTDAARPYHTDPNTYGFDSFGGQITLDFRRAPIPLKGWAIQCDRADLLPAHVY